jgi:thiol-disulfide isomerase/thioredoxin
MATTLVAGQLRLLPERPARGASISVEYIPDSSRFAPAEDLWLYVYEFTEQQVYPSLQEVPLEYQRSTGKYGAAFRLDSSTVFALCKVGNGTLFDTHGGRLWEILVYEQNKPLRGALIRAALSRFGTLQEGGWRRAPDLWTAEQLLQQAVREHPDNLAARIWLVAVQGRLGQLERAEYQNRLRQLLQQPYPDSSEADLRAVLWALSSLRERQRVEFLEERILQRFPHWELAQEILMVRLNRAAIAQEYIATAERFLRLYSPETPGYEEMYLAAVRALLQHDHPDSVAKLFQRYARVPVAAYAELANYWLDRNRSDSAETWVRMLQMHYSQQRFARLYRKPKYLSKAEWEEGNRLLHGLVLATEARLLRQQKRVEEAVQRFQEAWSVYRDDAPVSLIEQLVEALRVLGQHKNAFSVCTHAILQGAASDTLWAQWRELFLSVVRNDSLEMQQEMFRLQEQAAQIRRQRLWQQRLEWELPSAVVESAFVSPRGDTLTLSRLRGKVVLLDFWATWCRPCMESFPHLQKLWEMYQNRTDVAFVALNVWERAENRLEHVRSFLVNNPQYTFPVYVDERDIIPAGLGVTAIPTQIVMDRAGRVQFRMVGFSAAKYFQDALDALEVLLQQPSK